MAAPWLIVAALILSIFWAYLRGKYPSREPGVAMRMAAGLGRATVDGWQALNVVRRLAWMIAVPLFALWVLISLIRWAWYNPLF
jgi:hypothetical protein